jgi:hypothetical protein
MESDFMKRGYLLPEGCKDLFDALKLKAKRAPEHSMPPLTLSSTFLIELGLPEHLSVAQLAGLLDTNASQIILDLMKLGLFTTLDQLLDFEMASQIVCKYGFVAKKST